MALRTRVFHINKHELAVLKVDEHAWKIVIEFDSTSLTVFEQNGKLFTRFEMNPVADDDETVDESDDDSNIETQPMTPPIRRRSSIDALKNVTIRKRLTRSDLFDLEELQLELFGDFDAGDTQLDL